MILPAHFSAAHQKAGEALRRGGWLADDSADARMADWTGKGNRRRTLVLCLIQYTDFPDGGDFMPPHPSRNPAAQFWNACVEELQLERQPEVIHALVGIIRDVEIRPAA